MQGQHKVPKLLIANLAVFLLPFISHWLFGGQVGSTDATITAWSIFILLILFAVDIVVLIKFLVKRKQTGISASPQKRLGAAILIGVILFILIFAIYSISQIQI